MDDLTAKWEAGYHFLDHDDAYDISLSLQRGTK